MTKAPQKIKKKPLLTSFDLRYHFLTCFTELAQENLQSLNNKATFLHFMHKRIPEYIYSVCKKFKISQEFITLYRFHFLNSNQDNDILSILTVILSNYTTGMTNLIFANSESIDYLRQCILSSNQRAIKEFLLIDHDQMMRQIVVFKIKCYSCKNNVAKHIIEKIDKSVNIASYTPFCNTCANLMLKKISTKKHKNKSSIMTRSLPIVTLSDHDKFIQILIMNMNVDNPDNALYFAPTLQ